MSIYFYSSKEQYGCFSNFSYYGFELEGRYWKTSEHYFQSKKFENTKFEEELRLLSSPMEVARRGRDRQMPLRNDWEFVKDDVMKKAIVAKFTQNLDILKNLLDTGEQEIIEKTTTDYYWGCGFDGTGKNKLGLILMEVRKELSKSGIN